MWVWHIRVSQTCVCLCTLWIFMSVLLFWACFVMDFVTILIISIESWRTKRWNQRYSRRSCVLQSSYYRCYRLFHSTLWRIADGLNQKLLSKEFCSLNELPAQDLSWPDLLPVMRGPVIEWMKFCPLLFTKLHTCMTIQRDCIHCVQNEGVMDYPQEVLGCTGIGCWLGLGLLVW